MIQNLGAMAWNGFREARRNRVTVLVGAFALVLLMSTRLVTEVTVSTFDRVVTDFGLGVMSLMLVFLAIYLSSGLLAREIERRTIFLIVTKPMSRTAFLLARLAGNMVTLTVLLVGMTLLFWAELKLHRAPITQAQFVALLGLWIELLVLSSAGFLMSSFASQLVSGLVVIGLYIAGHLSADIFFISQSTRNPFLVGLSRALYFALPNLERFNFRAKATYALDVALGELAASAAYGLAWAVAFCALASWIFERRDFK